MGSSCRQDIMWLIYLFGIHYLHLGIKDMEKRGVRLDKMTLTEKYFIIYIPITFISRYACRSLDFRIVFFQIGSQRSWCRFIDSTYQCRIFDKHPVNPFHILDMVVVPSFISYPRHGKRKGGKTNRQSQNTDHALRLVFQEIPPRYFQVM